MALAEPKCRKRSCKHYQGIRSNGLGTEIGERPFCTAFPNGIPVDISYGENLHLKAVDGDNGIQYEKA